MTSTFINRFGYFTLFTFDCTAKYESTIALPFDSNGLSSNFIATSSAQSIA